MSLMAAHSSSATSWRRIRTSSLGLNHRHLATPMLRPATPGKSPILIVVAVSSRLSRGTQQPLAFWGAADIRWLAKTIDSVENDPYRPTLSLHPDRLA